jgi:hypothetical protein
MRVSRVTVVSTLAKTHCEDSSIVKTKNFIVTPLIDYGSDDDNRKWYRVPRGDALLLTRGKDLI